jgi:hypothetical protein
MIKQTFKEIFFQCSVSGGSVILITTRIHGIPCYFIRVKEISEEKLNILKLCGTLPQSATRPLKTYSTAVRAIPLFCLPPGTAQGQPDRIKKGSNAQQFIQLTVVGDINAKSG